QVYVILFCVVRVLFVILFFMYVAPPAIYTLSLHDALPISSASSRPGGTVAGGSPPSADVRTLRCVAQTWSWYRGLPVAPAAGSRDRKSTRLNSSHGSISYAVFCLQKKKIDQHYDTSVTTYA